VSRSDVEIAATLHRDIKGKYPYYNISSRLTEPSRSRLNGLTEVLAPEESYWAKITHIHDPTVYKRKE